MTPDSFFENFGYFANAPNGVQKLRDLILQLAVRGKLVPQDPTDEPAAKLMERIRADKSRLVKEKNVRKAEPLLPVTAEEAPYELPQGWVWERLGNAVQIVRGITFPASEKSKVPEPGRVACLRTSNVQNEIEWADVLYIPRKYISRDDQILSDSDIVMSMANSRELVGKVALVKNLAFEATFGGFLGVIRPNLILPQYLLIVLKTPDAREILINRASQTTNIANVSLSKLYPFIFPVPPLSEQHRIVAKVNELLVLCDDLESRQQKSTRKLLRLNSAALDRLTCASGTDDFAAARDLVRDGFDLLFPTPETIAKLRHTILQLAVQGQLVPQDPNDEPAAKLMARIRAEKTRLLEQKMIRKADLLPPVNSLEAPYELPRGWEWARVGEISEQFVDCPHDTPHYTGSGYICLRAPNIVPSRLLFGEVRFVSEVEYQKRIQRLRPQKNDLIYIREGGRLGIAGLITSDEPFCLGQRLMLIRYMHPVTAFYVCHFLNAPKTYERFVGKILGGASPHVNVRDVVAHPFPLPPLPEQMRIIAKVDQLMSLCDALEAKLTKAEMKAEKITAAAVQRVLAA